jgi:hypothetical protein
MGMYDIGAVLKTGKSDCRFKILPESIQREVIIEPVN